MQIHRAADLQSLPGIAHGFFGRDGGVSTGLYASLNCGPGSRDNSAAVTENRARAVAASGARRPARDPGANSQCHRPHREERIGSSARGAKAMEW